MQSPSLVPPTQTLGLAPADLMPQIGYQTPRISSLLPNHHRFTVFLETKPLPEVSVRTPEDDDTSALTVSFLF